MICRGWRYKCKLVFATRKAGTTKYPPHPSTQNYIMTWENVENEEYIHLRKFAMKGGQHGLKLRIVQ